MAIMPLFFFSKISLAYNFIKDSGAQKTGEAAGFDISENSTSIDSLIGTIIYVCLSLVGVTFFSILLYGAYNWMTSRGNDEKIKQATNTIINAIIGLVVTLGAYIISYFLISYFQ